jgi:FdhE protein
MTQDQWLTQYPSLRPLAELQAVIDSIMDEIAIPQAEIPEWKNYREEFLAGIPLLLRGKPLVDLRDADGMIVLAAQKMASKQLPGELGHQSKTLAAELLENQEFSFSPALWLLDNDSPQISQPGLLRRLGWAVLTRYFSKLAPAFKNWRDEDNWLRNYCPTCGSLPAMGQLVGIDPGRMRFLSCGCCSTLWRYRRTQCPFCERDEHRLANYSVEGSPIRIDYCESCKGYLKTYDGEGSGNLLLADWSSIHLDIVACDQGLKRFAESLYQL